MNENGFLFDLSAQAFKHLSPAWMSFVSKIGMSIACSLCVKGNFKMKILHEFACICDIGIRPGAHRGKLHLANENRPSQNVVFCPFHRTIQASVGPVLCRLDINFAKHWDHPVGAVETDQSYNVPYLFLIKLWWCERGSDRVRILHMAGRAFVILDSIMPFAIFKRLSAAIWAYCASLVCPGQVRLHETCPLFLSQFHLCADKVIETA